MKSNDSEEDEFEDLPEEEEESDNVSQEEVCNNRDAPEGFLHLLKSQFNLPPTVFVEYPSNLNLRRQISSALEHSFAAIEPQQRQFCKLYWKRICIENVFNKIGFKKTKNLSTWTIAWTKHFSDQENRQLDCLQKVNHFPNSWCIGRKDRLAKTIQQIRRSSSHAFEEFDFHPESFILPKDKDALTRFMKMNQKCLWIVKPCASSCGRGINVHTADEVVANFLNSTKLRNMAKKSRSVLVQKYLERPYLIKDKKFDLRIYVLVTGFNPLRIYIFEEGLTRISTSSYSTKNIKNRFSHLTNYSINKNSSVFSAASTLGNDAVSPQETESGEINENSQEGFKWSLSAFRRWLSAKEGEPKMLEVFDKIEALCVKTLIAAETEIASSIQASIPFRSNCFELFGIDVILDELLNPHLLEVNISPSLMGSTSLDKQIKGMLLADIYHIVGIYPHDPKVIKKYQSCFEFIKTSKVLSGQDKWRKDPQILNVDFAVLAKNDEADRIWSMILMIDDEIERSIGTGFKLLHPSVHRHENIHKFNNLYVVKRFNDHLLAKWILQMRSKGELFQLIPRNYLIENES